MLQIKHIEKSFPGVHALGDVSIDFRPGEVHAIVGENGAGKSTLIKIMCGIYQPDAGEMSLDGVRTELHSYRDAIEKSISLVSQEIQIIPKSTVAENIMLDKIEAYARRGAVNWKRVNQDAQHFVEMVELDLPVTTPVGGLSAAQKQLIMIARALSSNASVLILDEPTSSLTLYETENLLQLLRKFAADGVTVIFVSHKLEEVLTVADRVSVLRDGDLVGTREIQGLKKSEIVTMMIGRETRTESFGRLTIDRNHKKLEAVNISQEGRYEDLNFCLHEGEILGFYGLIGSGRTELAQILIGEDRRYTGKVLIDGRETHIGSMADSLGRYKMGYVSENRKEKGIILSTSIKTNIAITVWDRILNRARAINLRKETAVAEEFMQAVSVRATGPNQIVGSLSGGNQQKVSISKWLAAGCDILIIDEPTVGVDIGAKEYIHQLIWNLAKNQGKSIILISSDMPEIVSLARRILVFKNFAIVGEIDNLDSSDVDYDSISSAIGKHLA